VISRDEAGVLFCHNCASWSFSVPGYDKYIDPASHVYCVFPARLVCAHCGAER
jgi:hypothetical protein